MDSMRCFRTGFAVVLTLCLVLAPRPASAQAGMGTDVITGVVTGPDGCVYVALNKPDRIVRLAPAQ